MIDISYLFSVILYLSQSIHSAQTYPEHHKRFHAPLTRLHGVFAVDEVQDVIDSGGGVARRGGLQRGSEARPMEVRSDRTPQPARERGG